MISLLDRLASSFGSGAGRDQSETLNLNSLPDGRYGGMLRKRLVLLAASMAVLLCGCATNKTGPDANDSVIRKSDNTQIHGEARAFYGSGGH